MSEPKGQFFFQGLKGYFTVTDLFCVVGFAVYVVCGIASLTILLTPFYTICFCIRFYLRRCVSEALDIAVVRIVSSSLDTDKIPIYAASSLDRGYLHVSVKYT